MCRSGYCECARARAPPNREAPGLSNDSVDTAQQQRDCDDWAFHDKPLHSTRFIEHLRSFPLAPLVPLITAVAIGLVRLLRRRADRPAAVVSKPIEGMGEIGVPVDQSHAIKQLFLILAAGMLAFLAAWIAYRYLK